MKLAILMPVYNEEKRLKSVIDDLAKTDYDYMIVDDGSCDNTWNIIRDCANWFVTYRPNKGKGHAIKIGAERLIKAGYDYILIMDGDGQTSIKDITSFIHAQKVVPNAKIIIGNRLWSPKGMPKIRYLINRVVSFIISKLAGIDIPDTQCGFRLVHKDVFNIETKCSRFEYESEILVKLGILGEKIESIPIECIYFKDRKSKINYIKDTLRLIKMIWRIYNEMSLLSEKNT